MHGKQPKAIVVGSLAEARAALRAAARLGVPLILLSPAGAAGYGGAPWFSALVAQARRAEPEAEAEALLDCGASLGDALAALDSGAKALALTAPPEVLQRVAELAAACGARLLPLPDEVLELAEAADPEAACLAFLAKP